MKPVTREEMLAMPLGTIFSARSYAGDFITFIKGQPYRTLDSLNNQTLNEHMMYPDHWHAKWHMHHVWEEADLEHAAEAIKRAQKMLKRSQ